MNICVAPEVFQGFPGFVRYLLVVEDMDNSGMDAALEAMFRDAEKALREDDSLAELKTHPLLASWCAAFSSFGINPNRCPPSVLNLIKRIRGGKDMPLVNKLVAVFNIVSMRYRIPAGADDLDSVRGDLLLGPAVGNERYVPLGGEGEEQPKPGEVVLKDTGSGIVFCRAWCWKNGDVSKITEATRRAAVNLDFLPPADAEKGSEAAEFTADLLRRFCKATVTISRLDAASPCHFL